MDKCQHETHSWDLVYRCQGCGEIVQEQNSRIREASLEHQNKLLRERKKALEDTLDMIANMPISYQMRVVARKALQDKEDIDESHLPTLASLKGIAEPEPPKETD